MAFPQFVLREYCGGAEAVSPVGQIQDSDMSITVTGDFSNWPIGTALFSCSIDSGYATVEKILCSGFSPATGVLSIWTDGVLTGRGYDGTTAQAHVPMPSASIEPCWTGIEAAEANLAVVTLLGAGAGTPVDGDVFTYVDGAPAWTTPGVTSVPSGRLYSTSTQTVPNGAWTTVANMTEDYLVGGMTQSSGGLTVPEAGIYHVSGQAALASIASSTECGMQAAPYSTEFTTQVFYGNQCYAATSSALASVFSNTVKCTSGTTFILQLIQSSNPSGNQTLVEEANGQSNYISVHYVGPYPS